MRNLYTNQTLNSVNRKLNRRLAVLFVAAALLLVVFIWAMIIRIEWLAMITACTAGCFAVFFTDLFCAPLVHYRRLVRSALTGRSHEKELEYSRTEQGISVVDGVPCRSLIFLGEADKHGSREMLLYWDEAISLPELSSGNNYTVVYTGKNIIGIEQTPPAEEASFRH